MSQNKVISGTHATMIDDDVQLASPAKKNSMSYAHPRDELLAIAKENGLSIKDEAFARHMDETDPLRKLREDFHYPKMKDLVGTDLSIVNADDDCVYFCGNSLGLCPKNTKKYMDIQLDKWAKLGVQGHLNGELPWALCDECLDQDMAKLVGAQYGEVAIMNGLTVNLHLLLISFYRPTAKRYKILCEGKAFPSDHYAFESQLRFHGYDPQTSLICIDPREGEDLITTEDILAKIEEEGESIALVCIGGVQYYTGQVMEMEKITKAGHAKGCYVGFDLAHAVGNIEVHLHDWDIDFACWCTYKYLNSSAGSLAAIFIHKKHEKNDFPKLQGWWGHKMETRFVMDNNMDPCRGAYAYRVSNPPGLLCPPIKASLEVFGKTSMKELRQKSKLLTGYLEYLVQQKYGDRNSTNHVTSDTSINTTDDYKHVHVRIMTPSDPEMRGAQLSFVFSINLKYVFAELTKRGVVCDERMPSVIRIAPAPLYCSFQDVYRFMGFLEDALKAAAIVAEQEKPATS